MRSNGWIGRDREYAPRNDEGDPKRARRAELRAQTEARRRERKIERTAERDAERGQERLF